MAYGYITNLSKTVERKHVRYNNRYGMAIAGDLYQSKELDESRQYPAIIVGAPYGGTKEQGPAVYANQLAQMGFVVLTFDQVFMGESAGEPRNVSSPDLFAESFSAAVDYLGVKVPYVNREKIGVIGICGSAGFALSAAAVDPRIKAVVTTSMYDITNVRDMMNLTAEQLAGMKEQLANQRWVDFAQGYPEYVPSFPEVPYPDVAALPETDPLTNEWQRFYAVPRGFHPNARGNFTTTSNLVMLQFEALRYVKEISPRPILFVYGDRAHSRSFSEVAYEKAAEPREKYIVEDCEHIDLYDRVDKIPFEKIAEFMKENL
ncbi:MAG: alpha/beta hydrolase [Enterococcus gilvus]|nr:alpha/beta hydrolase [Enterococcus gilvus]